MDVVDPSLLYERMDKELPKFKWSSREWEDPSFKRGTPMIPLE
jgi:hypothetical protein